MMNANIISEDLHIEIVDAQDGADCPPAYDGPLSLAGDALMDGTYPATAYPSVGSPMSGAVTISAGSAPVFATN